MFQKSPAILTKNEDKPNSRYLWKVFSPKSCLIVEKLWFDCGKIVAFWTVSWGQR